MTVNVQGRLDQVDVPGVVELARQTGETVAVVITDGDVQGTIYVEKGNVVHAEYREWVGAEAFYHLLAVNEGAFELRPVDDVPHRTIEKPWNTLLLDALQYLDEHGLAIGGLSEGGTREAEEATGVENGPRENVWERYLAELLEGASAIQGVAIVGTDGLVYAAHAPDGSLDEDLAGAVAAAVYALSARSVSQLNRGNLQRTLIQGDDGNIIVTVVNDRTLFVGLTPKDVNLGMAFAEVRTMVRQLAEVVNASV